MGGHAVFASRHWKVIILFVVQNAGSDEHPVCELGGSQFAAIKCYMVVRLRTVRSDSNSASQLFDSVYSSMCLTWHFFGD